jgi:hypothetical protein
MQQRVKISDLKKSTKHSDRPGSWPKRFAGVVVQLTHHFVLESRALTTGHPNALGWPLASAAAGRKLVDPTPTAYYRTDQGYAGVTYCRTSG